MLLILGVTLAPSTGFSAEVSCDKFCGNTKDAIANLISDPKCKSDTSCVKCVGDNLGQSQVASYCSAYTSTSKSNKKQTIQTATYLTTAVVCGTACALTSAGVTAAAGATLSKVCGGLGLAAAGLEVIMAITSNDLAGAAMGAVGGAGTAGKNIQLVTGKVKVPVDAAKTKLGKLAQNPACMTFATYALLSGVKLFTAKSMKKAKAAQCDVIGNFGKSADAAVQTCQLGRDIPPPPSTGAAGMFAATSESFSDTKVDDGVKALGLTATDQFITDMKNDLYKAEELGKVNFGDIAKRVDSGEDLSSFIGGTGAPADLVTAILDGEARMKKGEKFKALEALDGGYSASEAGSGLASTGTGSGTSEMGFGALPAAPGEGVQSLEIDRAPAQVASALTNDGDILHSAFGGSIFDIVSLRIKEQKGQYAEAEPESRMNRVFNGYTDRNRQPAQKSGK